jgi:hypothetical protein
MEISIKTNCVVDASVLRKQKLECTTEQSDLLRSVEKEPEHLSGRSPRQ